jgi:hypothetical protein
MRVMVVAAATLVGVGINAAAFPLQPTPTRICLTPIWMPSRRRLIQSVLKVCSKAPFLGTEQG